MNCDNYTVIIHIVLSARFNDLRQLHCNNSYCLVLSARFDELRQLHYNNAYCLVLSANFFMNWLISEFRMIYLF